MGRRIKAFGRWPNNIEGFFNNRPLFLIDFNFSHFALFSNYIYYLIKIAIVCFVQGVESKVLTKGSTLDFSLDFGSNIGRKGNIAPSQINMIIIIIGK